MAREARNGSGERRHSSRASGANSDSRVSRAYRSPPPQPRATERVSNEHRSRRDSTPTSSSCLSNFYRERFGSHSPEDYLNLRLSQFDSKHSKEQIRGLLEREFRHLAPFEIKIVRNPEDDERMAYVNFERPECAKNVRRLLLSRLQRVLGRNIAVDPAGVIRDQEGKFVPDRYNRAVMAAVDRPPTNSVPIRRSSPTPTRRPVPKRTEMPVFHLNQNDAQAGRTLFVGNLPGNIRESELKRIFEGYGAIDDVDIKLLADSNASYAFILFETVEGSIAARQEQHNKPIRPGGARCQIGYGKSQQTRGLIVGGLGSWTTSELLEDEFGKNGDIEEIEYDNGSTHAIIRYAEIKSAIDTCVRMKNYPLGGENNRITVDYAIEDKKEANKSRKRQNETEHADNYKRVRVRTPSLSPSESPTRAGYYENISQLQEHVASTWKGLLFLKKAEYKLNLFRVFGREHLVQDFLRDSDGVSLKLSINQRLPIIQDLYNKLIEYDRNQLAVMFAISRDSACEPLIKYLQEKNAAGVVTLEGALLYVFTHSIISEKLLKFFAPRVAPIFTPVANHLLLILRSSQVQLSATAAATSSSSYGIMNANMGPPITVKKEEPL